MTENVHIQFFRLNVILMSVLFVLSPCVSIAQDRTPDFQGFYSTRLKSKLDKNNSKIVNNLKNYRKDKSVARLDESYNILIQSRDDIDNYMSAAIEKLSSFPENAELEKLRAQVDKLEIISIRDSEMPYLCDQLYEVGWFYLSADKMKAKQCFKSILERFTSSVSENCGIRAEQALESLR